MYSSQPLLFNIFTEYQYFCSPGQGWWHMPESWFLGRCSVFRKMEVQGQLLYIASSRLASAIIVSVCRKQQKFIIVSNLLIAYILLYLLFLHHNMNFKLHWLQFLDTFLFPIIPYFCCCNIVLIMNVQKLDILSLILDVF